MFIISTEMYDHFFIITVYVFENMWIWIRHANHPAAFHVYIAFRHQISVHKGHGGRLLTIFNRTAGNSFISGFSYQIFLIVYVFIELRRRPGRYCRIVFSFACPQQNRDTDMRMPEFLILQWPVPDSFRNKNCAGRIDTEYPVSERILNIRSKLFRIVAVPSDI